MVISQSGITFTKGGTKAQRKEETHSALLDSELRPEKKQRLNYSVGLKGGLIKGPKCQPVPRTL